MDKKLFYNLIFIFSTLLVFWGCEKTESLMNENRLTSSACLNNQEIPSESSNLFDVTQKGDSTFLQFYATVLCTASYTYDLEKNQSSDTFTCTLTDVGTFRSQCICVKKISIPISADKALECNYLLFEEAVFRRH